MKRFGFALTVVTLILSLSSALAATSWHTFTNKKGQSFQGSVIDVDLELGEATVVVRKTGRNAKLDFKILSDKDVEYLKRWTPGSTEPGDEPDSTDKSDADEDADLGEASSRLYPRTKQEIKSNLSTILKRKPPSGIERDQQEAVNLLNAYRYLCGVAPNAVAEKRKVEEAHQAAAACKKHGGLSHSIGHFTNKCNLHQGQSSMASALRGFISDGGSNNRAERGHRRWCLNPKMVKTGFGKDAGFVAMWALDSSGPSNKKNWSYPGSGYFPKDYLHSSGWSFYNAAGGVPSADKLKVEVYKLRKRPEKKFGITAEIPGRTVKVGFVHSYANTVTFEPDPEMTSRGGVFWVKIHGGGLREGYLVELY